MKEVTESKYDKIVGLTRAWEQMQGLIDNESGMLEILGGERVAKEFIAELKRDIRSLINNKEYVAKIK